MIWIPKGKIKSFLMFYPRGREFDTSGPKFVNDFFQDYVIDSNWRFRSTVMTPMFVDTQSSQSPQSASASQSGAMKGKLRATQTSLEFSQTQIAGRTRVTVWKTSATSFHPCTVSFLSNWRFYLRPPGRRTAFNWLTGSSVDTLAEYTPASESLSSLMVFDKKAERRIAARRPVGEGFGLKRPEAPSDELDSRAAGQVIWQRHAFITCTV